MVVPEILHIDMDAFFAAVEQRDRPELRGKPVVVGGPVARGVVAAASYEVRPFGVHSAMPMAEALRRCPHAVVVTPRHDRYAEVSEQVFAIFGRYTPLVEGLSVDEAFLDVTASRALFGDGETIARAIKSAIRQELGLTASAGVAPCKFVAKIASDLKKPDGLVVVRPDEVEGFLASLPIERMWGVGPVSAAKLRGAGLRTLGELASADAVQLEALLGSWGPCAKDLARGVDPRPVVPEVQAKSIGAEETFAKDLSTREEIERELLAQTVRVARRLFESEQCGATVVVKIKYADFTLRTRRVRLPEPVADTDSISRAAKSLLDRFALADRRVRLVGVAVTDLVAGPPPRTLFPDERSERGQKIESVSAAIDARFGAGTLMRATLLPRRGG